MNWSMIWEEKVWSNLWDNIWGRLNRPGSRTCWPKSRKDKTVQQSGESVKNWRKNFPKPNNLKMMTACNKCDSQEAIFKCSKCGKVMLNSKEKMSAYLGEFISKSVIMEINSSKRYIEGRPTSGQDMAQWSLENHLMWNQQIHHVRCKHIYCKIITVCIWPWSYFITKFTFWLGNGPPSPLFSIFL